MPRPAGAQRAGLRLDLEQGPAAGDTLVTAALKILTQPCSDLKAAWTQSAAQLWRDGLLQPPPLDAQDALRMAVLDTPARDAKVLLRFVALNGPRNIHLLPLPPQWCAGRDGGEPVVPNHLLLRVPDTAVVRDHFYVAVA